MNSFCSCFRFFGLFFSWPLFPPTYEEEEEKGKKKIASLLFRLPSGLSHFCGGVYLAGPSPSLPKGGIYKKIQGYLHFCSLWREIKYGCCSGTFSWEKLMFFKKTLLFYYLQVWGGAGCSDPTQSGNKNTSEKQGIFLNKKKVFPKKALMNMDGGKATEGFEKLQFLLQQVRVFPPTRK